MNESSKFNEQHLRFTEMRVKAETQVRLKNNDRQSFPESTQIQLLQGKEFGSFGEGSSMSSATANDQKSVEAPISTQEEIELYKLKI